MTDTEYLPYIAEALHLLDEKGQQWAIRVSKDKSQARRVVTPAVAPVEQVSQQPIVRGDAWTDAVEVETGTFSDSKLAHQDTDQSSEDFCSNSSSASETIDQPADLATHAYTPFFQVTYGQFPHRSAF